MHTGDGKDAVKHLKLTAVSCAGLYQQAAGYALQVEVSALEARRPCS